MKVRGEITTEEVAKIVAMEKAVKIMAMGKGAKMIMKLREGRGGGPKILVVPLVRDIPT
jgi:hypothetical protein